MENFSYHVPVYVVDSGVATSGHSSDMAAKKVGIFARNGFNVFTSASSEKEVFFAQAPNGGKDWYGLPLTGSHKSPFFRIEDVEDIYLSLPQSIQNEEWIIGYNGSPTSKGLIFEKGKATRVKLYFHGEPIYRFFNGPKEYVISHTPEVPCTTPCDTGDCDDAISDVILEAKKLIEKINTHTELQKFGVKAFMVFDDYSNEGTGGTTTATKEFRITLARTAAGASREADIRLAVAGVDGIVTSGGNVTVTKTAGEGTTTEGVSDDYVVTLTSYEKADAEGGLSSNVSFNYAVLPAIEGASWVEVAGSETDAATSASATPVANRKIGIRITAGYIDPKFGNCSFDPKDYYETQPVKMEVSLLQEDGSKCDAALWPSVLQTKVGRIARQTGEYVVRELLMKQGAYLKHMNAFSLDPRDREAFDQRLLDTVDRNAYYKLYYIRFKASYGNSFRKNEQEKFTAVFAIKDTDSSTNTAFNTNIVDVLETKTGIVMHTNSVLPDDITTTSTTTTTTL
jgi:hypothetical protein